MPLEIERKFLVKGNEWKAFAKKAQQIKQGYFSTNFDDWIVRLRIIDNKESLITFKKLIAPSTNQEFEFNIAFEDAESLWNLLIHKVSKKRYSLNLPDGSWVIDCFQNENSPLIIAEVELQANTSKFSTPLWCLQEVTEIKELSNAALSRFPISQWSEEKRKNFNLH